MRPKIKYIFALLTLVSISLHAQDAELVAKVSKNKLGLNQRLRIEFTVNKQGVDHFSPPAFNDFSVISGPAQSVSQSWLNGKASFSQSYTYIIQPKRKGELTISSASIDLNGKKLKSKPVKIIVLDAIDIPKNPNDPDYIAQQNVHLVAEISKSRPYVGEGIYVEYRLYISENINIYNNAITDAPQYNGFWHQNIKMNDIPVKIGKYNGERYRYAVLEKALLIPTKSGKLSIDPMKMDITIGIPTGRSNFFGEPITRNITRTFASAKKIINTKELPLEGKPESFNGAVGDFNFLVKANRNLLKSNETAKISVVINGIGNLKLFELPEIKTPAELEVFTPEQTEKIRTTSTGLKGSVTKNYTVVPEYKGKYKIPNTEFSYFDPKKKKYITIVSEDLFIEVLEGKEINIRSDKNYVVKKEVVPTGENFRYIQTKPSFLAIKTVDFFKSNSYYLLLFLPLLLIPIGIGIAKRNEARSNDVLGSKLRKADKLAKKYLSEVKKRLGKKEPFYIALEKALHNYLKAKLHIETSDISRDKITEFLENKNVDSSSIQSFIDVFNSCDMARYSPVTVVEMNQDYEKTKKVITQIDKQL